MKNEIGVLDFNVFNSPLVRKPHRLNLINRSELSGKSKEIEFRVTQQAGTIDDVQHLLMSQNYICGQALATVAFLALRLGWPLFLEGAVGIGKTEIANSIAASLLFPSFWFLLCHTNKRSIDFAPEWYR